MAWSGVSHLASLMATRRCLIIAREATANDPAVRGDESAEEDSWGRPSRFQAKRDLIP